MVKKTTEESIFPEGYEKLSKREKRYFRIMNAKSGVLYITAAPGYAKSAIMRSIAKKLNYQYFDIRLSMVDETDVGLFPQIGTYTINGIEQKMLSHVCPEWAYRANEKPTIIHFEELNRSTLAVRNAALQILLEREIGAFFKFNGNVLMCASGNLGEEDGTDVEEFDMALNNRLIHIKHEMNFPEWVEQYADDNVCPVIIQFLKVNTDQYYKCDKSGKNKAYATPRSWTFLSDYIFNNYGAKMVTKCDNNGEDILDENGNPKLFKKFPNIQTWINDIKDVSYGYVGASSAPFMRYCEDTLKISLDDILNNFDNLKSDIMAFNRDKKSELLANMKERKIASLKSDQIENLTKFLMCVSEDEIAAYLLHVIDKEYSATNMTDDVMSAGKFLANKKFQKFRNIINGHLD